MPDSDLTFIRGAVVGWRGAAILIPAASGAGTSTLVAALVRRGARYGSDGCALLDADGDVHLPTASDAAPVAEAPLRVVLVVATSYRSGCAWAPHILCGARALLPIVDHAVGGCVQPARVLRLAAALRSRFVTLASARPDADAIAPALLAFADAVLAGQSHARGGRIVMERRRAPVARRPDPPQSSAVGDTPGSGSVATYVVGGMPRSGTSMMMRALGAAGLDIFFDLAKEERLAALWEPRRDTYHPNPHGLHEPGTFRSQPGFAAMIRGRLVKLMGPGAAGRRLAPAGPFRVAYIHRDREAVARSHLAAFGTVPDWTESSQRYRQVIDGNITRQRRRAWVEDVTCFAYEDVVRDPLGQFSRLAELGWPIDPRAAAATVDPTLDRNGVDDRGRAQTDGPAADLGGHDGVQ